MAAEIIVGTVAGIQAGSRVNIGAHRFRVLRVSGLTLTVEPADSWREKLAAAWWWLRWAAIRVRWWVNDRLSGEDRYSDD